MIILQFDRRYLRWALLLLRSLELHEPSRRILCDTVGLEPAEVATVERAHPRVDCLARPASRDPSPAEMANRKPMVLRDALDRHPDEPWYCLLDADMLVRRPLDDLWSLVDDAHAALVFTNGMWQGRFYVRLVTVSSIVLLRPDGRELVERWLRWCEHDRPVDEIAPGGWFWDQVTLFLAWVESPLAFRTIPLTMFADERLRSDSAIWAANVPDKEGYHRAFRAEHDRQRLTIEGRGLTAPVP